MITSNFSELQHLFVLRVAALKQKLLDHIEHLLYLVKLLFCSLLTQRFTLIISWFCAYVILYEMQLCQILFTVVLVYFVFLFLLVFVGFALMLCVQCSLVPVCVMHRGTNVYMNSLTQVIIETDFFRIKNVDFRGI